MAKKRKSGANTYIRRLQFRGAGSAIDQAHNANDLANVLIEGGDGTSGCGRNGTIHP